MLRPRLGDSSTIELSETMSFVVRQDVCVRILVRHCSEIPVRKEKEKKEEKKKDRKTVG